MMDKAIQQLLSLNHTKDGDYLGEDGLLRCGICHTRKEKVLELIPGQGLVKVSVICRCRKAEIEKEQEKERLEELQIRRDRAFDFDTAMTEKTFENFEVGPENERIVIGAKNYVKRFPEMLQNNTGLVFMGDVGTGKSHLAAAITNALFDKGYRVRFTSLRNLTDEYMTTGFDDQDRRSYMELIGKYDLLVLDDFGAERKTEFSQETSFRIIDKRIRAKKPMILTTNKTATEMVQAEAMGDRRIMDRIIASCPMVVFKGESYRRKQAREKAKNTLKEMGFL